MNQTPNYQLNQWDKSDRIMMEDFNADNAKLDAALSLIPVVELWTTTLTEPALEIDVDVSGIDLTRFSELIAYFHFPAGMEAITTRIFVNHLTEGYPSKDGESTSSYMGSVSLQSTVGVAKVNLPVGRRLVENACSAVPTEEITSLNFVGRKTTSDKNFAAGTTLQLIGIRR